MVADNPAGRLLELIRKANEVRKDGNTVHAWHGWARVFRLPVPITFTTNDTLPPATQVEVVSRMLVMLNLVNDLEKSLSSIEGLPERYSRLVLRIRRVFQIHDFHSDWNAMMNRLGEGDLDLLEECEEKLTRHCPENVADQTSLEELLVDLNALYEKVMAAPMERDLREFLLDQLETIRRAIHEYRAGGMDRLRAALATNLGKLILNKDLLEKYRENEELGRVITCFKRLDSIIAFASNATTVISNVAPYLPRLLTGL